MFPNDPNPIEFLDDFPKGRLADKRTQSTGFRVRFPAVIYLISVSLSLSTT